jgi:hypothetical protein
MIGVKDGISWKNKKCNGRRSNFSICYRSYFNYSCFSLIWSVSVDFWINWGGLNPYGHIWILTLKRIYAEGLQQRILRMCSYSMTRNWLNDI